MPSGTAKPAVLRTAQLVKPDYWVVDKTSYPHRSVADGEQPAQFSAFAGFAYRAKECVQPRINENFIKASSGPREQRPQRQPRPRPLKKSPGKFDRTHAPSGQVVVAPVRQGGHNDLKVKRWAADVHEATERHNLRVPAGHVTPHKTDISSIGHGPCALIDTGASDDMPPAFPKDTSTSADLLGSVLDKDDGALSRYEAMAPHLDYSSGVTPAGPRSEVSSDLIDFSQDEDQDRHIVQIVEPSTTSLGAQQSHDEVACSDNGNDASAIDLAECLVKFGIEEDRPKDIRQTMNQQAGVRRRSTKKFVPLDTTRSTTPAQRRSTWSGLFKQQATVGPAPSPPASPVAADFLPGSMREELAGQVSSIMETLRVVPGNVTLELKFGLVWFRNLSEADVAINGTNPLWGLSTFQGDLNKEPHKADVGFEGVLSLRGDDADTLTKLHPAIDGQEAGWEEPDLAAQYEFAFSRPAQFRVIVDASTFKHQCLGPQEDVSSTYIHCPRNVWDLKIAACRAGGGTLPVECSKIAESLVASLAIS